MPDSNQQSVPREAVVRMAEQIVERDSTSAARKVVVGREGLALLASEYLSLLGQYEYERERADREKDRADALLRGYVETQEQAAGLVEQLETAQKALRDILALESRDGTYEVEFASGRWLPSFKVIADAALSNPAGGPGA